MKLSLASSALLLSIGTCNGAGDEYEVVPYKGTATFSTSANVHWNVNGDPTTALVDGDLWGTFASYDVDTCNVNITGTRYFGICFDVCPAQLARLTSLLSSL